MVTYEPESGNRSANVLAIILLIAIQIFIIYCFYKAGKNEKIQKEFCNSPQTLAYKTKGTFKKDNLTCETITIYSQNDCAPHGAAYHTICK